MQITTNAFLKILFPVLALLILSSCGADAVCGKPDILETVKKLFDQQQFGQFIQAPPTIFVVQAKSATLVSTDKQGSKSRCSAVVVTDLFEMMKFTNQYSEADLAKIKDEAPKQGLPLTKEDLVNYIVQTMASGQNYVTLLP